MVLRIKKRHKLDTGIISAKMYSTVDQGLCSFCVNKSLAALQQENLSNCLPKAEDFQTGDITDPASELSIFLCRPDCHVLLCILMIDRAHVAVAICRRTHSVRG